MNFIPDDHYRNRAAFSEVELAKYYGKEVAWNLAGTKIVASGDDPKEVCAMVRQRGLSGEDIVLTYVPFPDEVLMGGAWMMEDGDE